MSFRSVCIALGVLTFTLSFALSSWRQGLWRHGVERSRPVVTTRRLPVATTRRIVLPASWRKLQRTMAMHATSRQVTSTLPAIPPEGPVQEGTPGNAQPGDPSTLLVPVNYVSIRDPERPGSRSATIMNVSPNLLDVSVMATNVPTGSQMYGDVTIKPWGSANLADLGLTLLPGDEITVHSPPYQDQTFTSQ